MTQALHCRVFNLGTLQQQQGRKCKTFTTNLKEYKQLTDLAYLQQAKRSSSMNLKGNEKQICFCTETPVNETKRLI